MGKLLLDMAEGRFEVEADDEVVKSIYADIRDILIPALVESRAFQKVEHPEDHSTSASSEKSASSAAEGPAKKRQVGKRGGPSCATRIGELDGFFTELRDARSVGAALSAKGHNYAQKHIAAALINMTKAGKLRRIQRDGTWLYQNP